jgi:hypothetical protein
LVRKAEGLRVNNNSKKKKQQSGTSSGAPLNRILYLNLEKRRKETAGGGSWDGGIAFR